MSIILPQTRDKSQKKPRVRFAPSPTGPFHVGAARSALFNYLFAQKYQGDFILRIEDTDLKRSKTKYEEDIINSLKWLGLKWDEFYRQSERTKNYEKYLKKLLDSGKAYYDEIIWFKTPKNKKIVFNDLIRGKVEFDSGLLGDISIAKDLKTPLYNFAVVIDDYEMKINYVIRGEDHISNTPKQILIYEALGLPVPQFAHLPLILGPDRTKLSKRHGVVSTTDYRKEGYLPEALINFLALLGWSAQDKSSNENFRNEEIFTLKRLIKEFSLGKIQKGGAIFNIEKLDWFNGYYIRQKSLEELVSLCLPYLIGANLIKPIFINKQYPPAFGGYLPEQRYLVAKTKENISLNKLKKIVSLEQKRMKKLSEIGELTEYFFKEPKYKITLLKWKNAVKKETQNALDKLEQILLRIEEKDFTIKNLKLTLMPEAEKFSAYGRPTEGRKDRGYLLWPLRVALTGREKSPGPFEVAEILGKNKILKRIKYAQNLLK